MASARSPCGGRDYVYDYRDMDAWSSRADARWAEATGERLDGSSGDSRLRLRSHEPGVAPRSRGSSRAGRLSSRMSAQWILVVTSLALATAVLQALSVSVHSPRAYTVAGTAGSLVSVLVAFMFSERVRYTHERRDLIAAIVFVGLAAANLLLVTAGPASASAADSWHLIISGAGFAGSVVVLAAIAYPRRDHRRVAAPPAVVTAGIAILACGNAVALLTSGPYGDRLYAADALKLTAWALMLWGCVVELRNLRAGIERRASLSERRRIARDMHDGLAQELAFITIYAQQLGRSEDDGATAAHLRSAAERALHESRTALAVLSLADEVSLDTLVTRTVDTFRARFGVDVDVDLERHIFVDDEHRNALLRILHEALTNAVRHGGATRMLVKLRAANRATRLTVTDDGAGFDVRGALEMRRGLGLTSMSERAEILGGSVWISSRAGAGTVVEVELP